MSSRPQISPLYLLVQLFFADAFNTLNLSGGETPIVSQIFADQSGIEKVSSFAPGIPTKASNSFSVYSKVRYPSLTQSWNQRIY